jgi:serine/threonine protein kinase
VVVVVLRTCSLSHRTHAHSDALSVCLCLSLSFSVFLALSPHSHLSLSLSLFLQVGGARGAGLQRRIFIVMEFVEHDLKALMEAMARRFSMSEVKCLLCQLLQGVAYMHRNWILHRDLKTSNLLLSNSGRFPL